MNIIIINFVSLLSLSGFLISTYIYNKKRAKKKLICPRRSNCDTVTHSDYSKIFGIPVEVLGMFYYVLIGVSYSFLSILNLWSFNASLILLGISSCAVLFSMYLFSIQIFILKQWCIWCLSSAAISVLILILSYIHFSVLY